MTLRVLWMAAQIWDLESKSIVDELKPTFDKDFGKKAQVCCSLVALLDCRDSCNDDILGIRLEC